jgi:hypothetical protein
MTHITRIGPPLLAASVLAGGCGGDNPQSGAGKDGAADSAAAIAAQAPLHVSNVMIGRRLGSGNRVTDPTFQFAPQETVQVSVSTEGAGRPGKLTVAWRARGGEILEQTSEPTGPAGENTAFHLSRPAGLKPGTYKVVVFLGDDSAGTKVFVVKK